LLRGNKMDEEKGGQFELAHKSPPMSPSIIEKYSPSGILGAEPTLPNSIADSSSLNHSIKSSPPKMKVDVSTLSGPIRRYYEEQQELLGLLHHRGHDLDTLEEDDDEKTKGHVTSKTLVMIAVRASYASNIILLIVKIYALVVSGSLAMLASVLDSCLDILSGSVLFCAQRIVDQRNKYKYPIGKNRAQPIATIIFACLMGMSALQVIIHLFPSLHPFIKSFRSLLKPYAVYHQD
jgi:hypothetical protein